MGDGANACVTDAVKARIRKARVRFIVMGVMVNLQITVNAKLDVVTYDRKIAKCWRETKLKINRNTRTLC
jgi:hypothetical protein